MSQHTPGFWHISPADYRCILGNRGGFTSVVANVYSGAPDGQIGPDAKLIAAAPELLSALNKLTRFIVEVVPEPHNPLIVAAIAAIDKAT